MQVKIMLWYDVEDYVTPEADTALDKAIDMMDKRGIVSSLKIVAEKTRVLRNRGRFDIINKLAGHEICYHTNSHSRHPTVTEYLETFGFSDGAEEFERQEEKGLRDVTDITGQASTSYGQAGASWASQTFPALRKWGIPTYLDSHDIINLDGKPFWYGGILNLTWLTATMRVDLNKESGLDEAIKKFDALCEKTEAEQTLLISIFYHPCEFSGTEFWDGVNYSLGKNTPRSEWKPSTLREPGEMDRRIDMLGRFIDYTLTKGNVEYITALQSLNYEIKSNANITRMQIKNFANGVSDKVNFAILGENWQTPSELLSLMIKYLNNKHLIPVLSYGPEKRQNSCVDGPVKIGEMINAFETQYNKVFGYKQLPDLYKLSNGVINPVDMFCTLASAVSKELNCGDVINIINGELITEKYVKPNDDWSGDRGSWSIFPKDFKVPNTIRMAQLQTWTLKPARY